MLAVPLVPAAVAAALSAFALTAGGLAAAAPAILLAGSSTLALASVGHRRLVWLATAAATFAVWAQWLAPIPLALPGLDQLDLPRAALARPLERLVPAPESALLLGIVLGERGDVPPDLARAFNATGTSHLLAISGFNMTLVAAGVAIALRGRVGPVARAVVSALAIVAYSLLVGLSPSVLRAALMAGVAAFGCISGRRAAAANALCAAVVLMLVGDPAAVGALGLQLSVLATAGLVLWQGSLAARLAWLPVPLREGLATTLAASAPTLPVVAGAFGRVSLVSLAANLVCVPLFPLLMAAGAATSVTGALWLDAAAPVGLIAWTAAFALRVSVEAFAALPFASIAVPDGPLTGLLVAVLELVIVRGAVALATRQAGWMPRLPRGAVWRRAPRLPRAALAAVLAASCVPAGVAALWPAPAASVRVVALDVGQGDAYLVEAGGGIALIDGGPDQRRILDVLGATLPPWHRRIDVVALTHAHADHGAGLLAVLGRYEVGLAIEPEGLHASPLRDLWSAALAKNGTPRRAVRAGQRVELGGAVIDVLAPDPDLRVDVPSLVLRVRHGAFSALFTGDAVDDALARLLERPDRLRARVYVPPHHGAATPLAGALRDAARPDAALISVGAGNRYGHPTPATLAAMAGVPTYRTDQDGTVEISLDGTGLVVRTHANALPPPRRGSLPYPSTGE